MSGYPKTEAFQVYLGIHSDRKDNPHNKCLLVISAFPSGARYALEYFVERSGKVTNWRHVWNWAIQAQHERQLADADVTRLHDLIKTLPKKNVSPPVERLVLVSFELAGKWVTRSYDSRELPATMRQLYKIIGERFESKRADGNSGRR